MDGVHLIDGFPENLREQAAALYFEAFRGKLGRFLGEDGRGVRFVSRVMDPTHAVSVVSQDTRKLLGIAGFKTPAGALVGGEFSDLAAIYGTFGAVWRAAFLSVLERDIADGQLLMDGIAVSSEARGMGLGTQLLAAVCREAENRGLGEVRLDVIDSNPRARAIYERQGFVAQSVSRLGPFSSVFGFSSATSMLRRVGPSGS
jgi:ribosomal protein S18 acetylase RimI-like enzyme